MVDLAQLQCLAGVFSLLNSGARIRTQVFMHSRQMLYPLSYMLHLLCAVLLRQILYKYLSLPSLVPLFLPQSPEHWCYRVSEHFCFFSFFQGKPVLICACGITYQGSYLSALKTQMHLTQRLRVWLCGRKLT